MKTATFISPRPLPTYPDGFPPEIMERINDYTRTGWLVNRPYSGTSGDTASSMGLT